MLAYLKPILFTACLVPLGQLGFKYYSDDLTANPIEYITRFTGSWALLILLASLAVTPLRKLTGWNELIKLRRMLGLFAFFMPRCTSPPTWCSTCFSISPPSAKIS